MKTNQGFTVIELLVAVGMIGILSAIAIPSYQQSLQKSRRADAEGALLGLANAMERFYTIKNTYKGAAADDSDTGTPAATLFSITASTAANYSVQISQADDNTFTLTATPQNAQYSDPCGTLSISNAGVKTSDQSLAECWRN